MAQPREDASNVTEEIILTRLRAMVPSLRERAAETEALRHVPEASIAEAMESGFITAFGPRRHGGAGLGLSALAHGARILAQGCTSSAWTIVFLADHIWMVGKLSRELQDQLYADGPPMIAGALAGLGQAERVDGGFLVSGRSHWNSAIHHANWTSMKAIVDDEVHSFYMPVRDVVLDDGWHTSGMRGTSSDSFTAAEVFVPDSLVMPMRAALATQGFDPADHFRDYPYISVVSVTCSGVLLGAAEAAVEHFQTKIRERVLAFSGDTKQLEQPFGQMRLGEVTTKVEAARALWESVIADIDSVCGVGEDLDVAQRVKVRAQCALVVQQCRDAIGTIMNSAGGSSYFLTSPLQRIQRDVEVLKSHAMFDVDRVSQLRGRIELGLEPGPGELL